MTKGNAAALRVFVLLLALPFSIAPAQAQIVKCFDGQEIVLAKRRITPTIEKYFQKYQPAAEAVAVDSCIDGKPNLIDLLPSGAGMDEIRSAAKETKLPLEKVFQAFYMQFLNREWERAEKKRSVTARR